MTATVRRPVNDFSWQAMRGGMSDRVPALHNSGPAAGSVFRTAAVGDLHRLDIGATLCVSRSLPEALRDPMDLASTRSFWKTSDPERLPDRVVAIANALLAQLPTTGSTGWERPSLTRLVAGRESGPATDARVPSAVAALAERVAGLGALESFAGIARTQVVMGDSATNRLEQARGLTLPWLPGGDRHEPLRLAWCVCAVSYLAPPLLLWSRAPSLAWWRADTVILLRWFGDSRRAQE